MTARNERAFRQASEASRGGAAVFEAGQRGSHGSELNTVFVLGREIDHSYPPPAPRPPPAAASASPPLAPPARSPRSVGALARQQSGLKLYRGVVPMTMGSRYLNRLR